MELTITLKGEATPAALADIARAFSGTNVKAVSNNVTAAAITEKVEEPIPEPAKTRKAEPEKEAPVVKAEETQVIKAEETETPERITLEDIRKLALASKLSSTTIKAFLDEVGASTLSNVPEDRRAEFMQKIKEAAA